MSFSTITRSDSDMSLCSYGEHDHDSSRDVETDFEISKRRNMDVMSVFFRYSKHSKYHYSEDCRIVKNGKFKDIQYTKTIMTNKCYKWIEENNVCSLCENKWKLEFLEKIL